MSSHRVLTSLATVALMALLACGALVSGEPTRYVDEPGPDAARQSLVTSGALGIPAGGARTFFVVASAQFPKERAPFILQCNPNDVGPSYYIVETSTYGSTGGPFGVFVADNAYDSNWLAPK